MRMLSAFSQVCFAVLLAVFCHAQALDRSHHNKTLASHGFGHETRCRWNCTVIASDLTDEMKNTIARGKLIELFVKYENKVDDRCVNQTSRNSSANAPEHWQLWLTNQQFFTFARLVKILENWIFNIDSNKEHKEVRVLCTLEPSGTTATPEHSRRIQFPVFSRGHLTAHGLQLDATDCNTEGTENLQACSTDNNSTNSGNPFTVFERGGSWMVVAVYAFFFVSVVFINYSPAFLCLLLPTEVTDDGVHNIILEGASPVSLPSIMGNYFFSKDDGTILIKARTLILRVVIIPLPFIAPAFFTSLKVFNYSASQQLILVCCGFYLTQALYISFFTTRLNPAKPCSVCRFVKPDQTFSCQDKLPQLILSHLRLQPLIFVKCWRQFIHYILSYCKMTLIKCPSCKVAIVYLLRFFISIFVLSALPAIAVILVIGILLEAFWYILLSSPIIMLCKVRNRLINCNAPAFIAPLLHCCVTIPGTFGAIIVLISAGVGTAGLLLLGIQMLFTEESLPYVTCIVLVLYYVWSSYSSFTNSYQDLALALFKHYKKSRHDKFVPMSVNTDQVQMNITADYEDDVVKIPKRLFHMACGKLMPIREGVCILILKITIIASFLFIVFSIAMLRGGGASPVMKALMTFLTGLLPKILAIYIDEGRQKKIEAMVFEEKIPKIVQEYIKTTNGTSESNQGQDNSGADDDAEVILLNDNQENTSLLNL